MQRRRRVQEFSSGILVVNLYPNCFSGGKGTLLHELIHTIGFHRQQARADRDAYITVNENHIDPNRLHNFKKLRGEDTYFATFGLPYDYKSIMQYLSQPSM